MIVVSHQPLASSAGGDALLAILDRSPRVIAALAGHTHRNRIVPRATPAGGYWLITTASLIDYPQQARALQRARDRGRRGGDADLDARPRRPPATSARSPAQLSYLDAQGGRPQGFAGTRLDRNVTLFRAP